MQLSKTKCFTVDILFQTRSITRGEKRLIYLCLTFRVRSAACIITIKASNHSQVSDHYTCIRNYFKHTIEFSSRGGGRNKTSPGIASPTSLVLLPLFSPLQDERSFPFLLGISSGNVGDCLFLFVCGEAQTMEWLLRNSQSKAIRKRGPKEEQMHALISLGAASVVLRHGPNLFLVHQNNTLVCAA